MPSPPPCPHWASSSRRRTDSPQRQPALVPQDQQRFLAAAALAAAACGLGDKKGRLRAGYDADLLVVDGDPGADIGALARPVAVFAGGRRPAGA